jgi:hypothetical protein
MSIFDSIKKAIFGAAKADTVAAPTTAPLPAVQSSAAAIRSQTCVIHDSLARFRPVLE